MIFKSSEPPNDSQSKREITVVLLLNIMSKSLYNMNWTDTISSLVYTWKMKHDIKFNRAIPVI